MLMVKRFCWLAPMFLTVVLFAAGCGAKNDGKPEANAQRNDEGITPEALREAVRSAGGDPDAPVPPPQNSKLKEKSDIAITSVEYRKDHSSNPDAYLKYSGKQVDLTGIVTGYSYYTPSQYSLVLYGGGDRLDPVTCPIQGATAWNSALPGQTVTLRGYNPMGGPQVWEIVKVVGDPPPEITANQLAAEYAADPEGANERYKGKHFVATGTIAKVEVRTAGKWVNASIESGQAGPSVSFLFPGSVDVSVTEPQSLKPGQRIRVVGKYSGLNRLVDALSLEECFLLDVKP